MRCYNITHWIAYRLALGRDSGKTGRPRRWPEQRASRWSHTARSHSVTDDGDAQNSGPSWPEAGVGPPARTVPSRQEAAERVTRCGIESAIWGLKGPKA